MVEETSSKLEYQVDVYRYVDANPYPTAQRQTTATSKPPRNKQKLNNKKKALKYGIPSVAVGAYVVYVTKWNITDVMAVAVAVPAALLVNRSKTPSIWNAWNAIYEAFFKCFYFNLDV